MKHADRLIERILFLEGVPNVTAYDKIQVGASVKQQLENDLGLEQAALTVLKKLSFWAPRIFQLEGRASSATVADHVDLELSDVHLSDTKSSLRIFQRSESLFTCS